MNRKHHKTNVTHLLLAAGMTLSATAAPPSEPQPQERSPAKEKRSRKEESLGDIIAREEANLRARSERIRTEVAHLTPTDEGWAKEWAGEYYCGDGLGMNVSIGIAPQSGVTYTWHGCLGLYDANHGDIIESFPGGVKVKLAIDESLSTYHFMSSTLYFIKLGEHHGIIPEAQMREFVNRYIAGGQPRESAIYDIPMKVRLDGMPEVKGLPKPMRPTAFPPQFALLFSPTPLTVSLTAVVPQPEVKTLSTPLKWSVEIDKGSESGVFVGMEIPYRTEWETGSIVITTIQANSASGMVRFVSTAPSGNAAAPAPGWSFTLPGIDE